MKSKKQRDIIKREKSSPPFLEIQNGCSKCPQRVQIISDYGPELGRRGPQKKLKSKYHTRRTLGSTLSVEA